MLSQVILMVATATILPILLVYFLSSTADGLISAELARDARAIAAGTSPGPGELGGSSDEAAFLQGNAVRDTGRSGRRFVVYDASGTIVRQGGDAMPIPLSGVPRGPGPVFLRHGRYDVLSLPLARAGSAPQWIVMVQDRTVPEEIVDDVVTSFLSRFVWIVPASLLASLLVGLFVVRQVTDKFRRTAAQVDAISTHRIDVRLPSDDLPTEAAPLASAINRVLDRLEAGYRYQGEFVGNVAHELRTPLALISLRTEALDPSPERELILRAVERANHVVRQLRERAAIDRHYPEIESIDACVLVRDIVGLMAPLVFRADHVIAFVEPVARAPLVQGVPGLLQIALTNLIDNAVRHTPAGCTITVSVEPDGGIVVEDDGPGLAVETDRSESRRYRREGTNRSDSAGLGLSIVERIVTVCGGLIEIGNRPSGGARFAIRLLAATETTSRPKS